MLSIRDLGVVPEGMLDRAVPRNSTRYNLFRNAEGERHYASFADAAKRGEDPPNLARARDDVRRPGEPELDDAIRVIQAERTLNDAAADAAARDDALAALLDVFGHGDSRWDQIAAANVLDLHIAGTPHAEQLARVNQQVKRQLRNARDNPESNSLRPWVKRFSDRFPTEETDSQESDSQETE